MAHTSHKSKFGGRPRIRTSRQPTCLIKAAVLQTADRKGVHFIAIHLNLAEAVRFELTGLLHPTVFKTVALNHSATLPYWWVDVNHYHNITIITLNLTTSARSVNSYYHTSNLVERTGFEPVCLSSQIYSLVPSTARPSLH